MSGSGKERGYRISRRAVFAWVARVTAPNTRGGVWMWERAGAGRPTSRARIRRQGVQDLGVYPQAFLQLVETLLQLPTVSRAQSRLLPLLVLADGAVPSAPTARRLSAIALHLRRSVLLGSIGWISGTEGPTLRCLHSSHLGRHQHSVDCRRQCSLARLLTTRIWAACACRDG